MKKKKFRIMCYWTMGGSYCVDADSMDEAVEIASETTLPLPDNGSYVDGSFEIDRELSELVPRKKIKI